MFRHVYQNVIYKLVLMILLLYAINSAISSTFHALTNVDIYVHRSEETNISCIDNMTLFTRTHKRCILRDFRLPLHCS